jgi:hypothetical protein
MKYRRHDNFHHLLNDDDVVVVVVVIAICWVVVVKVSISGGVAAIDSCVGGDDDSEVLVDAVPELAVVVFNSDKGGESAPAAVADDKISDNMASSACRSQVGDASSMMVPFRTVSKLGIKAAQQAVQHLPRQRKHDKA